MQEDSLDLKGEFSQIIHQSYERGKGIFTVNLARVLSYSGFFMLVLSLVPLVLGCYFNFSCKSFIPTADYLGCFRGYDRFYILSCGF